MLKTARSMSFILLLCLQVALAEPTTAPSKSPSSLAHAKERQKWENIVLFYGDEETGEWSLRIRDKDVHNRAWFEFLELWQFDRAEKRWNQVKTDAFSKAISMPKDKGTDQPTDTQTLAELKEIEPNTAGLWWAKWKIDDVECGTLMRVGTWRFKNKIEGDAPEGMIKMAVPVDLDHSEMMLIPDPRIYCVAGGTGKAQPTAPKPAGNKQ